MNEKIRILYVVSNLARKGPVNQLYYLISNLDNMKFEYRVLTLSPEPTDSLHKSYVDAGILVESLSLSRLSSLVMGKFKLKNYLDIYKPHILQTQGIRADSFASNICDIPWITTSRNFPEEDYPSKFGLLKGGVMARAHVKLFRKCKYLVSCSNSIMDKLNTIGITSRVIANGVPEIFLQSFRNLAEDNIIKLISIGSLIPRKNMGFLIEFSEMLERKGIDHSLTILGDGPMIETLKIKASSKVIFAGNVKNVQEYLLDSDICLSSSVSEGLPNTILEAISAGLPLVLSDIPPHKEIAEKLPSDSFHMFPLDEKPYTLANKFEKFFASMKNVNKSLIVESANVNFGAKNMSKSYQKLYIECLNESEL